MPAARAGRVASICTGAFILAAAVFAGELSISPAAYQLRFSTVRRANAEQR
ncbi:MAG TPA: hypothetical protein VGH85_14355 [Mycobacteriales bacterium]